MHCFSEIEGQDTAVTTLRRALRSGRVHHAYRFEGPDGVGKELAALCLAAALVCHAPRDGEACGACSACHRSTTFTEEEPHVPKHPDVVVVERGLYPSEILGKTVSETNGISIHQIRRIVLSRCALPPNESRGRVFIVRAAHELTISAANTLLKTLEEPPARTHFVLLTDSPGRLLDTILSRTLAVRFGPLPEPVLARILERGGHDPALARLAEGSAAAALDLAEPERVAARDQFVESIRKAISAPNLGVAPGELDASDRRGLAEQLAYLGFRFAERARDTVASDPWRAEQAARRHAAVMAALDALEKNGQPLLALERLVLQLRAG